MSAVQQPMLIFCATFKENVTKPVVFGWMWCLSLVEQWRKEQKNKLNGNKTIYLGSHLVFSASHSCSLLTDPFSFSLGLPEHHFLVPLIFISLNTLPLLRVGWQLQNMDNYVLVSRVAEKKWSCGSFFFSSPFIFLFLLETFKNEYVHP